MLRYIGGNEYSQPSFGRITQQGKRRRCFVASAQHIGGARIFGAKAAWIGQAHDAADDDCKWYRTQQVCPYYHAKEGKQGGCSGHMGISSEKFCRDST